MIHRSQNNITFLVYFFLFEFSRSVFLLLARTHTTMSSILYLNWIQKLFCCSKMRAITKKQQMAEVGKLAEDRKTFKAFFIKTLILDTPKIYSHQTCNQDWSWNTNYMAVVRLQCSPSSLPAYGLIKLLIVWLIELLVFTQQLEIFHANTTFLRDSEFG